MTDILAVFRFEDPEIALTRTAAHDESAVIRPIREAGTDPESDRYLFSIQSDDFDRFEAGLADDPTVDRFERVITLADEAIYAFSYTDRAILFSTEIGRANGVILDVENAGTTWILTTWFPNRQAAQRLWEYANENEIDVELDRINEYGSIGSSSYGLTETQRNAILIALEAGYFDQPRGATLGEIATELDISQPAASGLLRRGIKRLLLSTVAESEQ